MRTGPGKGLKRQTGAPDGTERWSSQSGRTSAENAREHAVGKRGHAKEFGLTDREYVDAANDFVSNPPKTAEIFVRESGEVMIYDPPTNTFAVRTPEGVPATMFKPDSGSTYWVKELAKHGGRRTGR